jgi:thioredoxin reductase (NADPH)
MPADHDASTIADCAIVGAGPAGLLAATYLGRYRRSVRLLDGGRSRARYIPATFNCPGSPQGIAGPELLERLREQCARAGVRPESCRVTRVVRDGERFRVETEQGPVLARCVIAATGVVDRLPAWQGIDEALRSRVLRLCPVCDAFEASDLRIAVYGEPADGIGHAAYLRTWSRGVAALLVGEGEPPAEQRELAERLAIPVLAVAEIDARLEPGAFVLRTAGGEERFDVVYVALGSDARTGLFDTLRPACDGNRELKIDGQCRTSVAGLYAIGDAVSALNQLSVAFGHAALAASAVHRELPRNPA